MPGRSRLLVVMGVVAAVMFEVFGAVSLIIGAVELGILLASAGLVGVAMMGGGFWARHRMLEDQQHPRSDP